MVLLVLITSKCELLDGAFRLAEILADVSIASALIGHFIQISSKLVELRFQFPLCSSNGLIDISKVCKCLIGIGKLLLGRASLAICSLQQCTAFFKCILHSCSFAISCDLCIGSCRFSSRFFINLNLSIPNLVLILLDCVLSFSIACNGMLKCQ